MADVTYILSLKDRVSKAATQMQNKLNGITKSAESAADSIDNMGVLVAGAAVAGIFKLGSELETTTIQFNTLLGSVEAGTKLFDELNEFANATPFSNRGLQDNAKLLLGMGVNADDMLHTLEMLGSVAGTDEAKLSRMALQYGQTMSKGKLQAQEFNSFAEAGINIYAELSKITGKSQNHFRDMQEAGTLSAKMVTQAFEAATGAGGKYDGMIGKLSESMAGKWSTVMGKGMFLIAELGLAMKGVFTPILDQLISVIDMMSKYKAVIFPVLSAITIFISIVIALVGALKLFVIVMKIVNVLLLGNPIILIIAAIAAFIAILVVIYQKSEAFRRVIDSLWAGMKALWDVLKGALQPAFDAFGAAISELWGALKAFFDLFSFGSSETSWFSDIIDYMVTTVLSSAIMIIDAVIGVFVDFFNIISKVGKLVKAVFSGDFAAAKEAFFELGDTIKDFFEKRIKLLLKGFGLLGDAIGQLFAGDFAKAADTALRGVKQLVFSPLGVDTEAAVKEAEKVVKAVTDVYGEGAQTKVDVGVSSDKKKAASKIPGLDTGGAGQDNQVKKLQSEGIVAGGGIKSFNITIGNLTGINTLSTENIQESANQAGQAIRDELLKVLADTKQFA